ncbi:hypothetical protein [Microbacterium lacus]
MTDRTPSAAPTHRTRAEHRAAEATAIAPPEQPLTRAQLRERARSATGDSSGLVAEPVPVPEPQSMPVAESVPASMPAFDAKQAPEAQSQSKHVTEGDRRELSLDQVIGSGIRFDDRPLPPVVHVPQPTPFVRVPRVSYVPVAAANGPATTSLVVAGLALIGGLIANLLLRSDPVLAGLVNLAIVALLIAAFLLAAVGMTLAVQRPTRKLIPVIALVVAVLALAGVVALVAARLISLGALLAT